MNKVHHAPKCVDKLKIMIPKRPKIAIWYQKNAKKGLNVKRKPKNGYPKGSFAPKREIFPSLNSGQGKIFIDFVVNN